MQMCILYFVKTKNAFLNNINLNYLRYWILVLDIIFFHCIMYKIKYIIFLTSLVHLSNLIQ